MSPIPGLSKSLPEDALESVDCGMCGSGRHSVKFTDGPFSVVKCSDCGLTYVTPRLTDKGLIEEVYDEGYWSSEAATHRGYTDYRHDAPLYCRTYRKRLPIIRRHFAQPGKVLDVGCAAGYFLSIMQEEGWDVTGVEPSEPIRQHATELLGEGRVRAGFLQEAGLEPASFDLVTFWDVIEHIPDFVGVLRYASTLLRPGGKILIETQNVDSRAAAVLGSRWQHYKHAEHIYHFNPRTLGAALGRSGLQPLETSSRLGGKYVSMGFVVERAGRLHPLLTPLLSPLKLLRNKSLYVNLFDEMIVVAEPMA